MMQQKSRMVIGVVFLSLLWCSFPLKKANAAKIFTEPQWQEAQVGQNIQIDFFIDTKKRNVSALEGRVIFSGDHLMLKQITEANSIVGNWVELPKEENNEVVFAGVTPGGFSGEKGQLFSLIFEVLKEGRAKIDLESVRVLLNNGKGTQLSTVVLGSEIFIVPARVKERGSAVPLLDDSTPPKPFVPEVAKSEHVFGGKWFISFAAHDGETGIDHYEIFESKKSLSKEGTDWSALDWTVSQSPYLLKDQKLGSFIYVKAVDRSKNARIEIAEPTNKQDRALAIFLSIVAIVFLMMMAIFFLKKQKF